MNLDRQAAGRIVFGFEGATAPPEALELVRRGAAGAILFKRNIESPRQVAELSRALKQAAGDRPFLISVDQEGGRVQRLRAPWTEWPAMRCLGDLGDASLAHEVGRALGRELSACGIDLDYAPVLDVDTNPANPVIGDRAFSGDAQRVAELGVALALGLQEAGVAACGKHFPGHGDTSEDSHLTLPSLPHGLDRLCDIELRPFAAAAHAGVASMMTAHVVFQALDPGVPATMSRVAIDILRRHLRWDGPVQYDGVVISDDLEMKAVADRWPVRETVVRAAAAGVDLFLCCKHLDVTHGAIDALRAALQDGSLDLEEWARAEARVAKLMHYARPAHTIDAAAAEAAAGASQPLADRIRAAAVSATA